MPFDEATPRPMRNTAPPVHPRAAALNLLAAWRRGGALLSFQRAIILCAERRAGRAGERVAVHHIEAVLTSAEFVKEMYS